MAEGDTFMRIPLGSAGTPRNMLRVTAWIGLPPMIRDAPETLIAFLDDLLQLVEPYNVQSVQSGEPRMYRLNVRGRAGLKDALMEKRIEYFTLVNEDFATYPHIYCNVFAQFGYRQHPNAAARIDFRVWPRTLADSQGAADTIADFIKRWFIPLHAGAAFVSLTDSQNSAHVGDDPTITSYEKLRQQSLLHWPAITRYVRGAFWSNGLGPDLCARLGGQAQVLRDAPVFCAEPLGKGVWLQTSEVFPASQETLDQLARFLAPLLDWTKNDILPYFSQIGAALIPQEITAETDEFEDALHPMVAVRWLDTSYESDVSINIYVASSPTLEQRVSIQALLSRWYAVGFNGGFGGSGFHSITDASFGGPVIRCSIDLGKVDALLAFDSLRKRLAALPNIEVREVVLGTEVVG